MTEAVINCLGEEELPVLLKTLDKLSEFLENIRLSRERRRNRRNARGRGKQTRDRAVTADDR